MNAKTQVRPAIAEVLDAAANLIEPEGFWRQRGFAARADGQAVSPHDPTATCFCVRGAIAHVTGECISGGPMLHAAVPLLGQPTPQSLARWNDDPSRTQEEVVQALRDAANKSREASRG